MFDTPWKIYNEVHRRMIYPWVRLWFAINGIAWGHGWRIHGMLIIQKHRQSEMNFGQRLQLRSTVYSNPLGANHPVVLCTWQRGAKLLVGDDFGMTGGSIIAANSILIGNNVNVGANTTIIDTDFHPLDPEYRKINPADARTAPIIIEDDVFIGMQCLILKGVTIGKGSVIGAGSVVTKNVPAYSIVAGNPARVIKYLEQPNK